MPLKVFQKESSAHSSFQHIIGIAAGKGGVGKSTLTVNLGLALSYLGYTVGILDADIYGPSLRKMLPEQQLPQQKGEFFIPAFCHTQGYTSSYTPTCTSNSTPSHHLKMISMAHFRKEQEAAVVRAPIANSIITQFLKKVKWGSLDYLLIDFPPGTGDIQLTLSQQANLTGMVIITTPQEISLIDVRKTMQLFEQVHIPLIGLVENMSYYLHQADQPVYLFGQGGGERLAKESGIPFLGQVPLDPLIGLTGDTGQSLFDPKFLSSLASRQFLELTKNLLVHLAALKMKAISYLSDFEIHWKEMEKK